MRVFQGVSRFSGGTLRDASKERHEVEGKPSEQLDGQHASRLSDPDAVIFAIDAIPNVVAVVFDLPMPSDEFKPLCFGEAPLMDVGNEVAVFNTLQKASFRINHLRPDA